MFLACGFLVCDIFVWISYWGDSGFIELIWEYSSFEIFWMTFRRMGWTLFLMIDRTLLLSHLGLDFLLLLGVFNHSFSISTCGYIFYFFWSNLGRLYISSNLYISSKLYVLLARIVACNSLIICISVVSIIASFSFLLLLIFTLSLYFLMSLAKGISVLFIFWKSKHSV